MQKEEIDKLIEVWKILEILTVSLDRLGTYERINGEEASKRELRHFMSPPIVNQISDARHIIATMLDEYDDNMYDKMEEIAENDCKPEYWDGPRME